MCTPTERLMDVNFWRRVWTRPRQYSFVYSMYLLIINDHINNPRLRPLQFGDSYRDHTKVYSQQNSEKEDGKSAKVFYMRKSRRKR